MPGNGGRPRLPSGCAAGDHPGTTGPPDRPRTPGRLCRGPCTHSPPYRSETRRTSTRGRRQDDRSCSRRARLSDRSRRNHSSSQTLGAGPHETPGQLRSGIHRRSASERSEYRWPIRVDEVDDVGPSGPIGRSVWPGEMGRPVAVHRGATCGQWYGLIRGTHRHHRFCRRRGCRRVALVNVSVAGRFVTIHLLVGTLEPIAEQRRRCRYCRHGEDKVRQSAASTYPPRCRFPPVRGHRRKVPRR